jgi:hypothetical protein
MPLFSRAFCLTQHIPIGKQNTNIAQQVSSPYFSYKCNQKIQF